MHNKKPLTPSNIYATVIIQISDFPGSTLWYYNKRKIMITLTKTCRKGKEKSHATGYDKREDPASYSKIYDSTYHLKYLSATL